MTEWWDGFVRRWAGPQFPVVVLQFPLWIAMAAFWGWASFANPAPLSAVMAVLSLLLAVLWTAVFLGVRRIRRNERGSGRSPLR